MTIQKLGSFFSAAPELRQVYAQANHLQLLQQVFRDHLPAGMAMACGVSALRQGVLTVHADNGAMALKLKQMAPALLRAVQELDASILSVRIIVQIEDRNQARKRNKPQLGTTGCNILAEFAQNLQDTPLKSAISRMAQRHKR